jgi:hypothetical protein
MKIWDIRAWIVVKFVYFRTSIGGRVVVDKPSTSGPTFRSDSITDWFFGGLYVGKIIRRGREDG